MVGRGRSVAVGQRYHAIRSDGTPTPIVWEVIELYRTGPGRIEHARLQQVGDPTETRTFATAVLADRARFMAAS